MNILESIMAERRADVAASKVAVPPTELEAMAAGRAHHSLRRRLAECSGTAIVAEIKKASPSAGLLRPEYDPAGIASAYETSGAAGISILTEPRHFLGGAAHLRAVRAVVQLPILRKDFICDPYQMLEAAAWGADVVLLIVAALGRGEMRDLHAAAVGYGLEVLVESHSAAELDAAMELEDAILGVNSRNLKTLRTDLAVAREISELLPAGRQAIAESGIHSRADVESLEQCGYSGFLVGETLMKNSDPGERLRELLGAKGPETIAR
jgi:indole-3-glycerol phosphate synthase